MESTTKNVIWSSIVEFLLSVALGIGNLFLGWWILGKVATLWDIAYFQNLSLKEYWGHIFIISVLMCGSICQLAFKKDPDNKDFLSIMRALLTTFVLFFTWFMSWVWTSLFF